jgi:AraC-like DNA-binding protein
LKETDAPDTLAPGSVVVGARLGPGAGGNALGLPLSELRDLRVPVDELDPALASELPGDLEPRAAIARVAAAAARLVAARPPDALVFEAARRLARPGARVETLAGELGVSERQLRRRCHAGAGYGPKTLQRVLRFRGVLDRLAPPGEDLAALAAGAGYADQAHLTREFGRLAGLPPGALSRTWAM